MPKSTGLYISDELFDQVAEVAKLEDRSWNQTAMRLLKRGLAPQPTDTDQKTLLKQIHAQAAGEHLRDEILDDQMIPVYLSAGLLRQIAALAPFVEVGK